MKKLSIKFLSCLVVALCLLSTVSMCIPVNASGIMPYTYENPTFSFTGGRVLSYTCTGTSLKISMKSTASNNNNETITLKVYVLSTGNTTTFTYYSDGEWHNFDPVSLGNNGSNVRLTFSGANPAITIYNEMKLVS